MLQSWQYLEVFLLVLAAPSQGLRHRTSPRYSSTVMQAFEQQDSHPDTNSAGNLLSVTPQSSSVSMQNRQPVVYAGSYCTNWQYIYDLNPLCSECDLSQCTSACNQLSDCYYVSWGGTSPNMCYRLTAMCLWEPPGPFWQWHYMMVKVVGGWMQTHTVSTSSDYTVKVGWSRSVTNSVATAVDTSASAGFSFIGAKLTGSAEGSVSYSVAKSTVEEINKLVEVTESHTYTIEHGGYLWTWVWYVQSGNQPINHIHTHFKVQSDVSPKCLPQYQLDRTYQNCSPEGKLS